MVFVSGIVHAELMFTLWVLGEKKDDPRIVAAKQPESPFDVLFLLQGFCHERRHSRVLGSPHQM